VGLLLGGGSFGVDRGLVLMAGAGAVGNVDGESKKIIRAERPSK